MIRHVNEDEMITAVCVTIDPLEGVLRTRAPGIRRRCSSISTRAASRGSSGPARPRSGWPSRPT